MLLFTTAALLQNSFVEAISTESYSDLVQQMKAASFDNLLREYNLDESSVKVLNGKQLEGRTFGSKGEGAFAEGLDNLTSVSLRAANFRLTAVTNNDRKMDIGMLLIKPCISFMFYVSV